MSRAVIISEMKKVMEAPKVSNLKVSVECFTLCQTIYQRLLRKRHAS